MRRSTLVDSFMGPYLESPADELIEKAWEETRSSQSAKLARQALETDLDALDAYNILSFSAKTDAERVALLREAVNIGDRLWAPCLEAPDGEMAWWGFIGTRPYLRAMHNLGLALENVGDTSEASTIYRRLLELNPNDNQGIRYLLTRVYSIDGPVKELRALLKQYDEDASLEFRMLHLLLDIRQNKSRKAGKLISEINQANEFVLPLLMSVLQGKSPPARMSDAYAVGSRQEAIAYVIEWQDCWETSEKVELGLLKAVAGT